MERAEEIYLEIYVFYNQDGWIDGQTGRQTDRRKIWFTPCLPPSWDWKLSPHLSSSRKPVIFVVALFNMFAVGAVIKKGDC